MSDIQEEWRPIEGWEGYYEVSNLGRVRSIDRIIPHPKPWLGVLKGCIIKPGRTPRGYHSLGLSRNYKATTRLVHRLVAKAFIPNPNNLPCINHKDGVKVNNVHTNLEWSTYSGNTQHAIVNGFLPCGSAHPKASLSNSEARTIRAIYRPYKVTAPMLARQLGVSEGVIRAVVRNGHQRHYKNV